MKKAQIKSNLKLAWKKQVEILTHRRPTWILSIAGALAIFVIMRGLVYLNAHNLSAFFDRKYIVAGATYVGVAAGLYGWLMVRSDGKYWQKFWLYSAFDMVSLALMSLVALDSALRILGTTGLPFWVLTTTKTGIFIFYVFLILFSTTLAAWRLSKNLDMKTGLAAVKWAIAAPIFSTIAGSIMESFFSPDEIKLGVIALAALFLTLSFVLTSLWSPGTFSLALLLCYRIPQNQEVEAMTETHTGDAHSSSDEHERLLQEIHNWLEPQENLLAFTIGYYGRLASGINVILALTSKYLRIGSLKGGNNIPLQQIQNIEWSVIHSRIRILTTSSKRPLTFFIFGKTWKECAINLVDAWRQRSEGS